MQVRRITAGAASILMVSMLSALASRTDDDADPVRILDRSFHPMYEAGAAYVGKSDVGDEGETALVELGGFWQLAYFRNVLQSDLDFGADGELIFFTDSAGVGLPSQVGSFVLDAGATWRLVTGMTVEARARPGFYTDLESLGSDTFFMPFSGVVRGPITPELAGMLGLELRPDFERVVMPTIGLGWTAHPRLLVKAGLPESRLTYYATSTLTPYAGLDWRSTTYGLSESGADSRAELTIEDVRLFGGVAVALSGEAQIVGELGEAFSRDFEFSRAVPEVPAKLSVDDGFFFRVAIRGPF